jgi:hypothetical protein
MTMNKKRREAKSIQLELENVDIDLNLINDIAELIDNPESDTVSLSDE